MTFKLKIYDTCIGDLKRQRIEIYSILCIKTTDDIYNDKITVEYRRATEFEWLTYTNFFELQAWIVLKKRIYVKISKTGFLQSLFSIFYIQFYLSLIQHYLFIYFVLLKFFMQILNQI